MCRMPCRRNVAGGCQLRGRGLHLPERVRVGDGRGGRGSQRRVRALPLQRNPRSGVTPMLEMGGRSAVGRVGGSAGMVCSLEPVRAPGIHHHANRHGCGGQHSPSKRLRFPTVPLGWGQRSCRGAALAVE
eukprot:1418876-Rhodomonas_salina.1